MNTLEHDAFISYSHKDKDWVRKWLVPRLEEVSLRIRIDYRDFKPGANIIQEIESSIQESKKTIAVLSPDYVNSEWCGLEDSLTKLDDPQGKKERLIPIMLRKCEPPASTLLRVYLDFTDKEDWEFQFGRLLAAFDLKSSDFKKLAESKKTQHKSDDLTPANPISTRNQIYGVLKNFFNQYEIDEIVFLLGINNEFDFVGANKNTKTIELIQFCERRGLLCKLLEAVKSARPSIKSIQDITC